MKGKTSLLFFALMASCASVSGTSIAPTPVEGKSGDSGATTHPHVNCTLVDHYKPEDLIQGYLTLSRPLVPAEAVSITIKNNSKILFSGTLGTTSFGRENAKESFNFVLRRQDAAESYIKISSREQYLRLDLKSVHIAQKQPVTHVVRKGEDLKAIAMLYGVSQERIKTANNLTEPRVDVGRKLVIPLDDE